MIRPLYSLLMTLSYPCLIAYTLKRSLQEPLYRKNLRQRSGYAPILDDCIWLHCVSLGETIACRPLIIALQHRFPSTPLLITNTTATGSAKAQELLRPIDHTCYLPYDTHWAVSRFIRRVKPRIGIIMETEIWPNLIHHANRLGVPLLLNNARLSDRSTRGYQRIRGLMTPVLQKINTITAQTARDAHNFVSLGFPEQHCQVTGTIKFDLALPVDLDEQTSELKQRFGGDFIWIGASTHEGEEAILLQAHKKVLEHNPKARLLLVPRHPNRFDAVYRLCQSMGMNTSRHTENNTKGDDSVILGDVVGKMMAFYAVADVAFVGGSLAPVGGHNVIEPAALAKPIVCGPHMKNFKEISETLIECNALSTVTDSEELAQAIILFNKNPGMCQEQGQRAKAVADSNKGACLRQLEAVVSLIEGSD